MYSQYLMKNKINDNFVDAVNNCNIYLIVGPNLAENIPEPLSSEDQRIS